MNLRERYQFGPFHFDPAERECRRDGELIPITGKVFDLLDLFLRDPGRTIPKAELIAALWPETAVEESNLTQTVFLLRKALGDYSERAAYIQTVPRMGYKFVAPVTLVDATPVPLEGTRKRQWVVGLGATAAIVATAALLMGRGEAPQVKTRPITPFSFEAGRNVDPVWSPDGKGVAFGVRRSETATPQLYVRYLDSSTAMPLTQDQEGGSPIAWTLSGRIVFQSPRPPEGLWTISPLSGEAEPLLGMSERAQDSAHVSVDGSVVAYYDVDEDGAYNVMISAPPGSAPKPYTPGLPATHMSLNQPKARFSPDGKQILLLRNSGAGEETWLMPYPADTANPPRRILPNLPPRSGTPTFSWMPDNRRIVLSMTPGPEQPSQLYMADTVSGQYSVLSSGTTHQIRPAVSPDGGRVVFQDVVTDHDLVSIDLASARVSPLLATNRSEDHPAWAAKAAAMVYVTDRNGQREIWLHKPGESSRPLVTPRDFQPDTTVTFMNPLLSPDGSRLTYMRLERNGRGGRMWISAVAGGNPVRIGNDEPSRAQPGSWSPDGEWIAFLTFPGNAEADLYKVRTTGQEQPELVKAGLKRSGGGIMPLWSPTGEWIFNYDGGPKLISPDGKTEREIGSGKILVCGFSRDGALLYCMRQERPSDPGEFFSVPVAGGPENVIGSFAAEHRPQPQTMPSLRLTLTPDGKGFTYSIRKTTSNLWMLDGIE